MAARTASKILPIAGKSRSRPEPPLHLTTFFRRTSEVEIDQVEAEILDDTSGVCHHFGIAAKELSRDGMLVLIKVEIALGLLVLRTEHAIGRGELGHDQAASAEVANESPKDGVGNARHRSQNGRGSDLDIADRQSVGHGGDCTGEDARVDTHRIFPELAHLAILLPSPSYAAVAQFASHNLWMKFLERFLPNRPLWIRVNGSAAW